ncbi:MAG: UDP-N-acetylmuramate--L-alanine ligase [Pseudomonadota bacterium]|nr:UDP-N-acetylmuramate--L-alanine ligase [Pseudomonadota bacterium]
MRSRVRTIHFVGIGGAGMSGIAEVLHRDGYRVSGSDTARTEAVARLEELGITVNLGHAPATVRQADVVVVSNAIPSDNVEVTAARELGIPVIPRAEMLAELMRLRTGIAVTGTHGKTTTTSLIASLLASGGLDPTFVIGGRLNSAGANAGLGTGEYLVAEADESDASFLHLQPIIAVVTNIDADHMETYGGDPARLRGAFLEFLHHLPFWGLAVLCADDPTVLGLRDELATPSVTYGFHPDADYRAGDVQQRGLRTSFTAHLPGRSEPLALELNLPGRHNVANALAALVVALEAGVATSAVAEGLSRFAGIGRRFQSLGEITVPGGAALLVDDYAHHPRELAATVAAARAAWPGQRIVVLFQPHRYSRTRDLLDDFARELSAVDVLVLLEVYPAGEVPLPGADGRALSRAVRARGVVEPIFVERLDEVPAVLAGVLQDRDVLLALGAGSIGQFAARLPQRMAEAVQV